MNKYLRNVIVMLIALFVGVGLITLVQGIGHAIFPLPEGLDFKNKDGLREYVSDAAMMELLMVPISYFVGGMAAQLVACRWTKGDRLSLLIVGLLLLTAAIITLSNFPNPTWLAVCNVAGSVIPIAVGLYLAPRCKH
jgi:hypothetical protein